MGVLLRQTLRESKKFPLRIERVPLAQEEERYRIVMRVERPVNSCERGSADLQVVSPQGGDGQNMYLTEVALQRCLPGRPTGPGSVMDGSLVQAIYKLCDWQPSLSSLHPYSHGSKISWPYVNLLGLTQLYKRRMCVSPTNSEIKFSANSTESRI